MTRTQDDFGFAKPSRSRKGPGLFTPRHLIGRSVLDVASTDTKAEPRFNGIRDLMRLAAGRRQSNTIVDFSAPFENDDAMPATPAASSRPMLSSHKYSATPAAAKSNPQMKSQVDQLVFGHDIDASGDSADVEGQEEAYTKRRMKRSVIGTDGLPITVQAQSSTNQKPGGHRQVDNTPTPQKAFLGGSKRTYAWAYRPTAWDNPITYEDPPEPGKRPSHPVCANGIVATDRKRSFPDRIAMDHRNPLLLEEEEAPIHVDDAKLRLQEMKYPDTSWLTRWHYDPKHDIDPPKPKKFSLGMPNEAYSLTHAETVWANAAGKPGASDHYGPEKAVEEKPMILLTAR